MTASDSTAALVQAMGLRRFVALIAALMACNALAVDSMLPALPVIGRAVGSAGGNQSQWIVTAYLLGFGAAQIVYGTLADRFGRKPVLLVALAIYTVFSLVAATATALPPLLAARVLQGVGAAATRVLTVSIVRDCFSGSQMARVLSLALIVFLAVPILAPSVGQVIMLFGPWRWIFGALGVFGLTMMVWTASDLPETLHPQDRLPVDFGRISQAFKLALTNRTATGYMLAMTCMMGALFGFINSAQPIFAESFGAARWFTTVFAAIAGCMALSSFLNARIVGRHGPRRVSHAALVGYILCAFIHVFLTLSGHESVLSFAILQAGIMFCFGLVASNFGAIAMGPLGHIAGTGSSVQGFVTTFGGAVIGFLIGQSFDGTVLPFTCGVAVAALAALGIVLFVERGHLFQASGETHASPAKASL